MRAGTGGNFSYLEGHTVIKKANGIFGFDGWASTIKSLETV